MKNEKKKAFIHNWIQLLRLQHLIMCCYHVHLSLQEGEREKGKDALINQEPK